MADNPLGSVLEKLNGTHIHRAFLVDAESHVTGVISLREIIAQFVREPEDSKLSEYFSE